MKSTIRLLVMSLVVLCFALLPQAQAVVPPPDGGYPNFTTAEGTKALFSLTTGSANTAVGWYSLFSDTAGSFNTGVGAGTLVLNTGDENTAIGTAALLFNTVSGNTAVGSRALLNNTTGGTVANIQGIDVGPNVAIGQQALENNTVASSNTAVGYQALQSFTTGPVGLEQAGLCTAVGFRALANTTALGNSAFGFQALSSNTEGISNTAVGQLALFNNTQGGSNAAFSAGALSANTIGDGNTAIGFVALGTNVDGSDNAALGYGALDNNIGGNSNTAAGAFALQDNTTGNNNTAVGDGALLHNTAGNQNVALGFAAGENATTGDNNVYIGALMEGVAAEANHTYIRNINTTSVSGGGTDTVTVNLATGLIGHLSSSQRYKEEIKPMDAASEALYQLKPVSYRYKKDIDSTQSPAFGLIAEEVAAVSSALVACNSEGQPESVHYEMVNAMLLNEFLKEHKTVQELKSTVLGQQSIIAQQRQTFEHRLAEQEKQIKALTTIVEKVNAQLAMNNSAPRVAASER
jgi:hypothetical protein